MILNIKQFIMAIIPTSYFVWTADFTGACLILAGLMGLDLITGIRKAIYLGCLSSKIAKEKTIKKILDYTTFLVAGYLVNMFFLSLEPTGYVAKFIMNCIGEFIEYGFIIFVGFLIGVEGYSILENLAEMGMPMPQKIVSVWSKNIKNDICK